MSDRPLEEQAAETLEWILEGLPNPVQEMRAVARDLAEAGLLHDEGVVRVKQGIGTFVGEAVSENELMPDWLSLREDRLKKLLPQMTDVQGWLAAVLR